MTIVFAVEEVIRQVMHPFKVNLAALGNMVPHIHWHVIPRFKDDAFYPGPIWAPRIQKVPELVLGMRQKAVLDLPNAIREQISRLY
jgi:diadenosine tetraphosphate (Ap4A) HIT family hydrolase